MIAFDALVLSLPTRNSTVRMRVWRSLKDTGCGALREGLYVLPKDSAGAAVLAKIESEIKSTGGSAMTVELKLKSPQQVDKVRKLFDRSTDYGALVRNVEALHASLPRLGVRKARTAADRLLRSFDKLVAIDFFPGQAKIQAAEAIAGIKRRLQEVYASGEPHAAKRRLPLLDASQYQKRTWSTRKDLWVDRLASAWLIKRFIDRSARFVWIDGPRDRPKRAIGFDFDGAEFTHVKGRVTFEVLLASFGLDKDSALVAIGTAVHYLDIGGIPVADAKGLETVLRGVKQKVQGDDALLVEAMRILDSFYSAYSQAQPS